MSVLTAKYLRISKDPHDERLGVTRQNEDLDERFRRRSFVQPVPLDARLCYLLDTPQLRHGSELDS